MQRIMKDIPAYFVNFDGLNKCAIERRFEIVNIIIYFDNNDGL